MDEWLEHDPLDEDYYDEYDDGDYVPHQDDFDDDEYAEAAELWATDDDDEDPMDAEDEDPDFPGAYITSSHIEIDSGEMDDSDEDGQRHYEFAHPRHLLELAALLNSASNTGDANTDLVRRLMAGTHVTRPAKPRRWWKIQKEPHPRGLALLRSGEFGPVAPWSYSALPPKTEADDPRVSPRTRRRRSTLQADDCETRPAAASPNKRRKRPSERYRDPLMHRPHLYAYAGGDQTDTVIPNTNGTIVARYPCVPYVGQFCGPNDSIFCKRDEIPPS